MESYPEELLVGVFPLVFCVDASLPEYEEREATLHEFSGSSKPRSHFDRFLDALAGCLLEENPLQEGSARSSSLFQASQDDDSNDEDDVLLTPAASQDTDPEFSYSPRTQKSLMNRGFRSPSFFGSKGTVQEHHNTSYATALQQNMSFFQRARIQSIGIRHGFPPSQDPAGDKNRILSLLPSSSSSGGGFAHPNKTVDIAKLMKATHESPMEGIFPAKWLEKHAHALPSVLILVAPIFCDSTQPAQDAQLIDTLENLAESLAAKRDCTIQIVGLVQDGVSRKLAENWKQQFVAKLETANRPTHALALLELSELNSDSVPSPSLKELHNQVRDASLTYYMHQAKRTRLKLAQLGGERRTPLLLPLAIRYCMKLAFWYEFQWKFEKSIRFFAEAYRHVESYYRYLLLQKSNGPEDASSNPLLLPPLVQMGRAASTDTAGGDGVELSIDTNTTGSIYTKPPPPAPADMVHQCRAVADWLNFKLLQAGFASHTEVGLLAASNQWRMHNKSFLSEGSFCASEEEGMWYDWLYVSRQREIVGQLLERHPPKALGDLGNAYDDHILRCSPWRTYQAAAEAELQLGYYVKERLSENKKLQTQVQDDDIETRYLGGIASGALAARFQEISGQNNLERALEFLHRALPLFEREYDREMAKTEGDTAFREKAWSRSGSRLYYLAGGTCLGLGRHKRATEYLEKAISMVKGWDGLEKAIRKMLVECYEKELAENGGENLPNNTISEILDSYFYSGIPTDKLQNALKTFSVSQGTDALPWYRDCFDENDLKIPFSFSLTFPSATHATAGDSISGLLLLKSNLDYPIQVDSLTLLGFSGQISISSKDLLGAENITEGASGGIVIEPQNKVTISTSLDLPTELEDVVIDETNKGDEKTGTSALKFPYTKSARPRTGGITAGAGARLVYKHKSGEGAPTPPSTTQWSTQCLGGKPFKCDGLIVVFSPVSTSNTDQKALVKLTIEKKRPQAPVNVKRTPFEEDNYISSAWSRPHDLPLQNGPRCLRVLPPAAKMQVTNLTEPLTSGKALEGTVNRLLLKLEPGPSEHCADVKIRCSCTSTLLGTEDGVNLKILSPSKETDEPFASIIDPNARAPVLVYKGGDGSATVTEYGSLIPDGWELLGKGQGEDEDYSLITQSLDNGKSAYAVIDLFRPLAKVTRTDGTSLQGNDDDESSPFDRAICQTDLKVTITYRQTRDEKKGEDSKKEVDAVTFDYQTKVTWNSPLSAVFSSGTKESHPSGNRHPTNSVPDPKSNTSPMVEETEMVLVDGERVVAKCNIEAAASADGLLADIMQIRFEEDDDPDAPCSFNLVSGKKGGKVIYEASKDDPCRHLKRGSKFAFSWTADVKMKEDFLKGSVSASLGIISVDWRAARLDVPEEIKIDKHRGDISFHGPLALDSSSTCRFMGPPCYIENAPFHAVMDTLPTCPKVAEPFNISYRIRNKTHLVQRLLVNIDEKDVGDAELEGLMISGLVKGEVAVGPGEVYVLSYSAIPTRTGALSLPKLSIASDRYKTWVVNESLGSRRSLFVIP